MATANSLRPELELLITCARSSLTETERQRLRELLQQNLNWDWLTREALFHNLLPLVHNHLSSQAKDLCPSEILERWRLGLADNLVQNMQHLTALLEVVQLFQNQGIKAAAFKGPIAAMTLYGNLGLRTFEDIDILVAPAQARKASDLLIQAGHVPQFTLRRDWEKHYFRTRSERSFSRAQPFAKVDLHWGLMPPGYSFTPKTQEIFKRLRTIRLGNREVLTPAPEDLLIYYCLHGAKHDWVSLGWLCDLAELLRRHPDLDWDRILAWSMPLGRQRLVFLGLFLVNRFLAAPVPALVRAQWQRDSRLKKLADEFPANLQKPRPEDWYRDWPWNHLFFQAMAKNRDHWRLIHDWLLLPCEHDWLRFPLPAILAPLYYIVRPLRLICKHGFTPLGTSVASR